MTITKGRTPPPPAAEAEERAAALRLTAEQVVEWRALWKTQAVRLATGILAMEARGWPWAEPEQAFADDWPGMARLMYLFDQLTTIASTLQQLQHLPGHPLWCVPCHNGAACPDPKRSSGGYCPVHTPMAAASAHNLAGALGFHDLPQLDNSRTDGMFKGLLTEGEQSCG